MLKRKKIFKSGEIAKASEVNAEFDNLIDAINDLRSENKELKKKIQQLEEQVSSKH
ncbi:MAG: hypothetical protein AB7V50_05035 [Vampirovibrionia bacterium]